MPDLIKLCQEAQNAVKRQAEALQASQAECTLELVALKKGGTTLEFGLPKPQLPVPLKDFGDFGLEVVGELANSI